MDAAFIKWTRRAIIVVVGGRENGRSKIVGNEMFRELRPAVMSARIIERIVIYWWQLKSFGFGGGGAKRHLHV